MTERRPEDFDRDFLALTAGLELGNPADLDTPIDKTRNTPDQTRDRLFPDPTAPAPSAEPEQTEHPWELDEDPRHRTDDTAGERDWFTLGEALEKVGPEPEPNPEDYLPEPLPPLARPRGLALVGWACFGLALLILVLLVFGVRLPGIMGWVAIAAFVAAMLIGWRSLPRHRDPYDGDGAVV